MSAADDQPNRPQLVGLVAGPLLAVAIGGAVRPELGHEQSMALGVLVLMAVWWLTFAVPLAVTALLPAVVFPIARVGSFAESAAPYASDVIFLFAGGFLMAHGLEQHGLTVRFARAMAGLSRGKPAVLIGMVMVATALLSGFISNAATVAAMLPIALAAIRAVDQATDVPAGHPQARGFATAILLGVAYAASIGGGLTLIGSPPNAITSEFLRQTTGEGISFVGWLRFGLPIAALMLPIAWLVLTQWHFPVGSIRIGADALAGLGENGPMSRAAKATLAVFSLAVLAWLTRPQWATSLPGLTDAGIALSAGLAMLILPASFRPYRPLLPWVSAHRLPWDVLILFGGGLSLAAAIDRTGLATTLGGLAAGIADWPFPVVLVIVLLVLCFASEFASNTALTATAMPVVAALATTLRVPAELLCVPAAFAASLAFMLPVGTPPNAMVFATGRVRPGDMLRAGLTLNLVGVAVVTAITLLFRAL